MAALFRFAVIADSHIRYPDDGVNEYASNALMVERNRFVVSLCNRLSPDFVIHLGDVVHPLPAEANHESAVRLAQEVFSKLQMPIHFAPGNHDIGDKPNSLVAVPSVAPEFYEVFERVWGPPFQSFDHGDRHFVLIDTPVLNSGLGGDAEQRTWLEADLAAAASAGVPTFVFGHYPPFIRDADEPEHYDNLAEPARGWLLDLLARYEVSGLFSGHVHNFFYNRHRNLDMYVAPSTGFVRPDYAEMATISPEPEGGRDDPAKLGFFVVDVSEDGHRVHPIRTYGRVEAAAELPIEPEKSVSPEWRSPIGVTLRHDWCAPLSLPTEGLDQFRRKTVRNDYPVLALWEARIPAVRVPVGDLLDQSGRGRLRDLHRLGLRFSVFSAGVPDPPTLEAITDIASFIDRWELLVGFDQLPTLGAMDDDLRATSTRIAVGPIIPLGSEHETIHHFVTHGFDPEGGELLTRWLEAGVAEIADELVYRVSSERDPGVALEAVAATAGAIGPGAIVNLEMPRADEHELLDDDRAVARRARDAVAAAHRRPEIATFLDTFMDHDRSYYRRHGLIDRRFNPRPALYELAGD